MATQTDLDYKQQIQDQQYNFPYHYIPTWENGSLSLVQYWGMSGLAYMGRLHFVTNRLEAIPFNTLVDIGCGDGRLLREMALRHPQKKLLGIDYSERSIQLAQAMNPGLNYKVVDIIEETSEVQFDAATLIETLEHIPLGQVKPFVKAVADLLGEKGWLILTVPHTNMKLQERHYQHFTSQSLIATLQPYFQDIEIILLDPLSIVMRFLSRLVGGRGNYFIISNRWLVTQFYKLYVNRYLYTADERICRRLAAVCRKK